MKRFGLALIALVFLFTGCQQNVSGSLDTTNLEKVEPEGNTSDEQLSGVPLVYEASSLEEGLKALPFEINLPKELPFEAMPLKIMSIEDFGHDGKKISVNIDTISKNEDEKIFLMLRIENFEVEYAEPLGEKVELDKGIVGYYNGEGVIFEKDGLYYGIGYDNENITPEQHKIDTINIANQML